MESIPIDIAFKIRDSIKKGFKIAHSMKLENFKKLPKEVRKRFFVCPEITTKAVIKKNFRKWG
jgi:hypothetical protein